MTFVSGTKMEVPCSLCVVRTRREEEFEGSGAMVDDIDNALYVYSV